jgi:hypothetical protein
MQRSVGEWSGQMFGMNPPGLVSRPYLVMTIEGEPVEVEYTEWTHDRKPNWEDAVLVAEFDEEPRVNVRWHKFQRSQQIGI